jgi:transposase
MARPVDPAAQYRVKPHVTNGYTYASTQPPVINSETGKKVYRRIHWGTLDENLKFTPGTEFYLASPEERAKLIFPDSWDLSEANKLTGLRRPGRPPCSYDCQNRLYGDIWLLEQIATKTGIRQDLEAIFNGNREMADDILTLAMFPYLTQFTYNRVARWQANTKTPSPRELTPSVITRLTQHITEQHRMDLLALRATRLKKDEVCAVDSTTRSAYGESLADIRWGKNKEHMPLAQTTEVVVYTLSSHTPVYYRTFPGNIPDSRTVDVILKDLEHAGFKNLVLITDRGYETIYNLEKLILRKQSLIMCTKITQKDVSEAIESLGEFSTFPESMEIEPDEKICYKQFDIAYEVKGKGNSVRAANRLKLNLYFDPSRRCQEVVQIAIDIKLQKDSLDYIFETKNELPDDNMINNTYYYFKVSYDPVTRVLLDYKQRDTMIARAKKKSGFFSIMTHGLDFDAMKTYHTYRLRDEQEKYFQQMKSLMVSDRQRNWSEEGKTGRLLILFVSLILGSHVRNVWKSTSIHDLFSSSLEVLDEMRSIRCIEHTDRAKVLIPFVGKQVDICKAFGFEIPKNCAPIYTSQRKPKPKRGRPPKKSAQLDY